MRFDVVTIFPEAFETLRVSQIWQRAEASGKIEFRVSDLREFTDDPHRVVDDAPYGGGAGMVMKVEPLVKAVERLATVPGRKVLYASPQGRKLDQAWVRELARLPQIVVIAGRYEGVDERFIEGWVDESFSVGDYVLSGGELPAMTLIDCVTRMVPGVVGDWESVASDSFSSNRLKYPQYTRPAVFRGRAVPEVLRSGNHEEIRQWRQERAWERTQKWRPDLLSASPRKDVAEKGETVQKVSRHQE